MDVGDHELLQVRTLICDTDELRHGLYVLSLLAGISPLLVEESPVSLWYSQGLITDGISLSLYIMEEATYSQLSLAKITLNWLLTVNCH